LQHQVAAGFLNHREFAVANERLVMLNLMACSPAVSACLTLLAKT
jgi:hypothetical protein